jgi:hypothetical protein
MRNGYEIEMDDLNGAGVLAEAVHRAALARVATTGPHWVSLLAQSARELTLPPTPSSAGEEPLGQRLDEGRPLTPLADPQVGGDLGAWAERPASVGDLLAARGTHGERVVGQLERQCALEAARFAPMLADDLARQHPGLAAAVSARHPPALTGDGGPLDPAAALACEVAALLALEMVAAVSDQLAAVPLTPEA